MRVCAVCARGVRARRVRGYTYGYLVTWPGFAWLGWNCATVACLASMPVYASPSLTDYPYKKGSDPSTYSPPKQIAATQARHLDKER